MYIIERERQTVCVLCVALCGLCVIPECVTRWLDAECSLCGCCVFSVCSIDGNAKTRHLPQTDKRTQTHATHSETPHWSHKGIIYPLCVHSNKGMPPVCWQKAGKLRDIGGGMGGFRRAVYTYTLSHFFIKTTGITQGTLIDPSERLYKAF